MYLLLIEDDLRLGNALLKLLKQSYRVQWLRSLEAARRHIETAHYDAVLLDLGLPDGNGIDWLRDMRAKGWQTPVLILSARDTPDDRVVGLDTGADDYLIKPFDSEELLARIRVLLRRKAGTGQPVLAAGELEFAADERQFYLQGRAFSLPPKEFEILAVLIQSKERAVRRDRLLQQLYGIGDGVESNTLDVHIHSLRKHIGKERIETLRGFGYRLAAL